MEEVMLSLYSQRLNDREIGERIGRHATHVWQWRKKHSLPPVFWMNPPYGREIGKWIQKAYEESQGGGTVVCLVPSRTDTRWWHDYCMQGEVRFIRGRLKFGSAKNSAPFPSAIVIFKGGAN